MPTGYVLSPPTAARLGALLNRVDLSVPASRPLESGAAPAAAEASPHLILRLTRLSPVPIRPSGAWTLDGAAVSLGNVALPRILAIATNLAMPEAVDDATVGTLCIGHRVAGFSADIGEGS